SVVSIFFRIQPCQDPLLLIVLQEGLIGLNRDHKKKHKRRHDNREDSNDQLVAESAQIHQSTEKRRDAERSGKVRLFVDQGKGRQDQRDPLQDRLRIFYALLPLHQKLCIEKDHQYLCKVRRLKLYKSEIKPALCTVYFCTE